MQVIRISIVATKCVDCNLNIVGVSLIILTQGRNCDIMPVTVKNIGLATDNDPRCCVQWRFIDRLRLS